MVNLKMAVQPGEEIQQKITSFEQKIFFLANELVRGIKTIPTKSNVGFKNCRSSVESTAVFKLRYVMEMM